MPVYSLFGDQSGLPRTTRSSIPYEIEALTPRETWGAGNSNSTIVCRQKFDDSADWVRDMVGEVKVVKPGSTALLQRYIPEALGFGDGRVQFCSICDQTEQGEEPNGAGSNFANELTGWPQTKWCKYKVVFEAFPYAVIDDAAVAVIQAGAGAWAGAPELYRYVVRTRRTYSREQPIPAASTAGGFKIIDDAVPANRKPIGQVGFRVVAMADVTYKWVRVPVAWPPPVGYAGSISPWPPAFNPVALDPATVKRTRDSFIGTINSTSFDCAAPDGYCWDEGVLLYTGYDDSHKYWDAAGNWVCDVIFSFKFKEGGWNKFLSARGEWKAVSLDGTSTGTRPYATNDFNALFKAT